MHDAGGVGHRQRRGDLAQDAGKLAEMFLFRELFRRPSVQNNPETMGLLRLAFPLLEEHARTGRVPTPLAEAGVVMAGREAFADHYPFDEGDMLDLLAQAEALRATPVTTRKDFVRIPPAFRSRVTVVTVRLEWAAPTQIESLLEPLAQRVPVPA